MPSHTPLNFSPAPLIYPPFTHTTRTVCFFALGTTPWNPKNKNRVDDIRVTDQNPGIRDYEASLLRLLDKLSNGMAVEINESGTALKYKPGIVTGGRRITHDCGVSRGMGYFLEVVLTVALFAKKAVDVTLTGITNDEAELSVDTFRTVTLPMLKRQFGIEEGLSLQIVKRGCAPGGGGEIQLKLPIAKELKNIDWTDEGLVKRVRGVAFTLRVSPQTGNRLVDASRGVLNKFLPDVYIFTDHHPGDGREGVNGKLRGKKSTPGFGISLVAETTTGCLVGVDVASSAAKAAEEELDSPFGGGGGGSSNGDGSNGDGPNGGGGGSLLFGGNGNGNDNTHSGAKRGRGGGMVPEDMGTAITEALVAEVQRGGVVDSSHQPLVLLLMSIGPEQISRVRLGQLTPRAVQTLRIVKAFFGVTFNIQPEPDSGTVFLSTVGAGIKNISRRAT